MKKAGGRHLPATLRMPVRPFGPSTQRRTYGVIWVVVREVTHDKQLWFHVDCDNGFGIGAIDRLGRSVIPPHKKA